MSAKSLIGVLITFSLFVATGANAQDSVNFGNDTSQWANDGECDDPRFEGQGMASILLDEDAYRDATDCRSLYNRGMIRLKGSSGRTAPASGSVNFGDNTSQWANDGECDDPRFEGRGMATTLLSEDLGRDANDCRSLFNSGMIRLRASSGGGASSNTINFGDNTSQWANDGECDDPRFEGEGVAATLLSEDLGRDANDCRTLFNRGMIRLRGSSGGMTSSSSSSVNFGNDASQWANDGECDDPRFVGDGMAAVLLDEDLYRDATDCRNLYNRGMIRLR